MLPLVPATTRSRALKAWGWKQATNPEPSGPRMIWVKVWPDALESLMPHEARHVAASFLLAAGVPLFEVSRYVGHTDIRTTANMYGHLEQGQERDRRPAARRAAVRAGCVTVARQLTPEIRGPTRADAGRDGPKPQCFRGMAPPARGIDGVRIPVAVFLKPCKFAGLLRRCKRKCDTRCRSDAASVWSTLDDLVLATAKGGRLSLDHVRHRTQGPGGQVGPTSAALPPAFPRCCGTCLPTRCATSPLVSFAVG